MRRHRIEFSFRMAVTGMIMIGALAVYTLCPSCSKDGGGASLKSELQCAGGSSMGGRGVTLLIVGKNRDLELDNFEFLEFTVSDSENRVFVGDMRTSPDSKLGPMAAISVLLEGAKGKLSGRGKLRYRGITYRLLAEWEPWPIENLVRWRLTREEIFPE